jgi:hypothetical protein
VHFAQAWRPTKEHKFPYNEPMLPAEASELLSKWTEMKSKGAEFVRRYIRKLAIETNHVESVFLISAEVCIMSFIRRKLQRLMKIFLYQSTKDLIRRGFSDGTINIDLKSAIQDPNAIKNILNDTIEVSC